MSPDRDSDASGFAAVRSEFHRLAELDTEARTRELAVLAARDARLAASVAALFERFDVRDLDAPMAVRRPQQLGPFRVLRQIGRGGMGEVFQGERNDGAFEQQVALKLIRADYAGLGLDERFRRERQILARLQHPHIARLIDGGVATGGQAWLAMEFVDGVDLATWVASSRPDLRRRIALFGKICDAVAFAHRALIVHRDLKPANVLVGSGDEPKLLDFGIAKLIDDEADAQTRTMMPALTLRYAAPEQVLGDRTTTATDVYALGVMLFELIAGASPYAAQEAQMSWRDAIVRGQVCPLSAAMSERSCLATAEQRHAARDLTRVITRAMALEPADRYSSAAALGEDLRDWLDERPLRSGVGTLRERLRLQIRRYRWPLLAGTAASLALILSTVVALREAAEARHQALVASANFDALLGVLSAANPMHYAGRDPTASEFLVTAAAQIRRDHAHDPALVFRALGEIGHGLINLGHADRAEAVLFEAMAAADRDASIPVRERLGYLKLLALSLAGDERTDLSRVRAIADRIEALAALSPGAPNVADALASIAAVLSRLGDGERAAALFEQAVAGLKVPGMPASQQENIWRQKGWAALRAGEAGQATRDFSAMRAVIDATPGDFDPIRVAEADWLLAEAAVDANDAAAALQHLARAEPVLLAEFGAGHPERRSLALTRVAAELAAGDVDAAMIGLGMLAAAGFPPADAREQARIDLLLGTALIVQHRCAEAAALLDALQLPDVPSSPRLRAMQARIAGQRMARCK